MSDLDPTPLAARRLRTFGRRRAPEDEPVFVAGATADTTTDPLSSPEPHTVDRRRWRRERPDHDAVNIEGDQSHAWWAERDDLERVVTPKPRGAAARARRAAREAFAPPGTTARPRTEQPASGADGHPGGWDPSNVYSWSAPSDPTPPSEPPPAPAPSAPTPWDVLGLTSEASWAEVTQRHRQLAKQHHPDLHAEDDPVVRSAADQRMADINAAFTDLRRVYRLTDGT